LLYWIKVHLLLGGRKFTGTECVWLDIVGIIVLVISVLLELVVSIGAALTVACTECISVVAISDEDDAAILGCKTKVDSGLVVCRATVSSTGTIYIRGSSLLKDISINSRVIIFEKILVIPERIVFIFQIGAICVHVIGIYILVHLGLVHESLGR
jgi:hypothetical protein